MEIYSNEWFVGGWGEKKIPSLWALWLQTASCSPAKPETVPGTWLLHKTLVKLS